MAKNTPSSELSQPSQTRGELDTAGAPASVPMVAPVDLQSALDTISGLGTRVAEQTAPVQAAEAAVDDDLARGGPAFGKFLSSVGLAVAETQAALDATLVKTTQALADTKVKTVAVFEQVLKDDGTLDEGKPVVQELPALAFIAPTGYAFTQVHLTADMDVSEFNTANGLNIRSSSFSAGLDAGVKYGLTGWSGSADLSMKYSNDSRQENTSSGERRAAGKLHLEATLEPRRDIQLPKPFVIQRGPRLQLSSTRENLDAQNNVTQDSTKVAGRRATITAKLTKFDPEKAEQVGIDNQILSITCDHPALNYTLSGPTANGGVATITVDRTGAGFDPKKKVEATVQIGLNLIQEVVRVTL